MDAQAPAVVAVVVTTDPGPWFEETLTSLANQDYQEFSVLVLATGEAAGLAERVGRILPEAFVRQLEGRPGYAAAANEALSMVEGASFFLLCHDDCALDADAVHQLVEESFRSNAGVVSPKFVNWDDPSILLHVGMSCDKTGAVVDRVQLGEMDHGQHDAVRDVFVAPGGCVLVRADLWRELGGYDPGIVAMGEDLDLSWRSQVAGSRLVVAPDARVRHREVVAGGLKPLSVIVDEGGKHPLTMQALQRRHELRTVLKCYSWFHLLRVLPQAALLALGEVFVALLARDRDRVRAVIGAWRWNLAHRSDLRALRKEVRAHRLFPDAEVRRLQLRGSARLSQYFSRLSHQGLEAANAVVPVRSGGHQRDDSEVALLTGSVGLAFSEDSSFDELDDFGHRSGRDRFGRKVRSSPLTTGRQRVVAVSLAALIIALGTRELFFGNLPLIGQLAPLPGWTTTWHHLVAGWHSSGVGTTAPATPAFGLAGALGTLLFGAMGTTQRVLLLGCIPLGALGMSGLMRPLVSPRARVVAVICYLALPLPYGALGTGRWDGLVAYAAFPFILGQLARAAGVAPFNAASDRGWRATRNGRLALFGLTIAASASFAPAIVPLVLACALAWEVGSLLSGTGPAPGRLLAVAGQGVVVALVLSLPWALGSALAGRHAVDIFGLPISPGAAPSWGEVIRFAVGPAARSPVVWLLVAAAALPLVLGTGSRLAWAARLWLMACLSWAGAMASSHGWMGAFTPSESVMLAPAAVAVAACIGLGIASFESDLAGRAFGWHQVVSGVAVVAVVVGMLPVALGAISGRWNLPTSGAEQPLAFLSRTTSGDAARVLWLGDPRALPVGGWAVEPGLAYGLTDARLPDSSQVWTPAGPGPADTVHSAVQLAISGGTVHLGRLLAGAGVRYIIVVNGLTPAANSLPTSVEAPAPSGLARALLNQNDLRVVPGEFGVSVFENSEAMPTVAQRSAAVGTNRTWTFPTVDDVLGWRPALRSLSGTSASGTVAGADLYVGYAPAGDISLSVAGHTVARHPAFGWAAQFTGTPAGAATLSVDVWPFIPVAVVLELVGWLVVVLALLGWRRWPLRRPSRRSARRPAEVEA